MPERSFSISAPAADITPDAQGKAAATVTVTSTALAAVRAQTRITPIGQTPADWFSLPEPERDFNPAETHQFAVNVKVPPGAAPGKYPFRVDVCNTANSDDDYTEGPQFALNVAAPPPPDLKPPSRMWILFLIIGLVVVGGITTVVIMLNGKDKPAPGMVKVPKLVGVHIDQVRQLLGTSAPVVIVSQPDPFFVGQEAFLEGFVTKQEPAVEADIAPGGEVKVWLQPKWSKVPPINAARDVVTLVTAIQGAEFNVKLANKPTTVAADDAKVADVSPASGTMLAKGGQVTVSVWDHNPQPVHRPVLSVIINDHVHEIQPDLIRPRRFDLLLPHQQ